MGFAQYVVRSGSRAICWCCLLGSRSPSSCRASCPAIPINNYISQVQARAGQTLTPEATQQLRSSLEELYGLKGNLFTQYVNYLNRVRALRFWALVHLYPEPVSAIILNALPWTAGLLLTTTLLSWMLGNWLGWWPATSTRDARHRARDLRHPALPDPVLHPGADRDPGAGLSTSRSFRSSPTLLPGPLTLDQVRLILYNSFLPALTLVLAGFGWNILSMKSLAVATKEEPMCSSRASRARRTGPG